MIRSCRIGMVVFLACWLCGPARVCGEEREWSRRETRHFAILFQEVGADFVGAVAAAAEASYDDITGELGIHRSQGWADRERVTIYIYRDQEAFQSAYQQHPWANGIVNVRRKIIRTFPAAHGFFDSTLPHELGHIIFRQSVGDAPSIPLWMDEGVAMYQEKGRRWGAHQAVQRAIEEGTFIPLPVLSKVSLRGGKSRAFIDLYYHEAASAVSFLIGEYGKARFERFCRELKAGVPFEAALAAAYPQFRGLEDLDRRWRRYLEER